MPRVALTFDDGPGPSTPAILDALAGAGVRATFFVLGRNLVEAPWGDPERAKATVRRAIADGHVIGNHTYSHVFPDATCAGFVADVVRGDEALEAAGLSKPPFRLPYGVQIVDGALDPRLPLLASLGKTHVHWSGDFADWLAAPDDAADLLARMLAHVAAQAARGLDAVLDLHDSGTGRSGYRRDATAAATAAFVTEAQRRGWTFFTTPTPI